MTGHSAASGSHVFLRHVRADRGQPDRQLDLWSGDVLSIQPGSAS